MNIYETKLTNNELSQEEYAIRTRALIAFTEHASAKGFRKKVFGY